MAGQYYVPPHHGMPLSYVYDEGEDLHSSTQSASSLPLFSSSYDNASRTTQQDLLQSASNITSAPYSFSPQLSMSQPTHLWSGGMQSRPNSGFNPLPSPRVEDYSYEGTSSYIISSEHGAMFSDGDIPRGWRGYHPRILQVDNSPVPTYSQCGYTSQDFKTPAIMSSQQSDIVYESLETSHDYPAMDMNGTPTHDPEDCTRSPSHYPSLESITFNRLASFRIPSSETSEDGSELVSREMTVTGADELGIEEPYAKLIHRALMSAPNHSMVLQEIYQWFRENTSKGSSDSKGWMNSIRHNLSMNAAFKKTERKLQNDDTKKSTEWVLEDFAIRDGVQSTTRYRKGNANKKSFRSDAPAPARHRSGQKGGISSRHTARMRRADQLRRPQIDAGGSLRGVPGHFQRERQREPLTPPHPDVFPRSDSESFYGFTKMGTGYDLGIDGMCGLDDVQGVHMDGGPVFATDHGMGYHGFPGVNPSHEQRF